MQAKTKYSLIFFLVFVVICAVLGVYYVKLSLSESIKFDKGSLEYRLLTPDILKNINTNEIGKVRYYYYSAADGNKPLINALELESTDSRENIEKKIEDYLLANHFEKIKPGEYQKGKQKISILFEKAESSKWNINISLIEII